MRATNTRVKAFCRHGAHPASARGAPIPSCRRGPDGPHSAPVEATPGGKHETLRQLMRRCHSPALRRASRLRGGLLHLVVPDLQGRRALAAEICVRCAGRHASRPKSVAAPRMGESAGENEEFRAGHARPGWRRRRRIRSLGRLRHPAERRVAAGRRGIDVAHAMGRRKDAARRSLYRSLRASRTRTTSLRHRRHRDRSHAGNFE
jgi:hypothetical protein